MTDQWSGKERSAEFRDRRKASHRHDLFNETMEKFHVNEKFNQTGQNFKEKIKQMPAVLTNTQLKNLDEHKYSSGGSTLLDPLFQPFWCWLVEQMPLWIAPNTITIIGLIINIISCSILFVYSPNATDYVSL